MRNICMIVSTGPGSGADTLARIVADSLTPTLNRQVIVENRSGGAGNIGAQYAARSAPDGYTLYQINISLAINTTLYRNLPYNLLTDFAPISLVATGPAMIVVHPLLPALSLAELVKLAKVRPGAINYSSGGAGTATFLTAELFKAKAGIDLLHVPYRGGGAALTAVLTGEAPVYFSPVATALPQVKQRTLRALAVTSAKRLPLIPQLPTVAESGYPGFESGNWYGLAAPSKTPHDIISALHRSVITTLEQAQTARRLVDLGYITIGGTPEQFSAHLRSEVDTLAGIVRKFQLSAE